MSEEAWSAAEMWRKWKMEENGFEAVLWRAI